MPFYKFLTPDGRSRHDPTFVYPLPEGTGPAAWAQAPASKGAVQGVLPVLHVMVQALPTYAPDPYVCWEVDAEEIVGSEGGVVFARRVRLCRRVEEAELDSRIADVFEDELGSPDAYKRVAWARRYAPFGQPVDAGWIRDQLAPFCQALGRPSEVKVLPIEEAEHPGQLLGYGLRSVFRRELLGDLGLERWGRLRELLAGAVGFSLNDCPPGALTDSGGYAMRQEIRAKLPPDAITGVGKALMDGLWSSIYYAAGFVVAQRPQPALDGLLAVWEAGACPLGWPGESLLVVARVTKEE